MLALLGAHPILHVSRIRVKGSNIAYKLLNTVKIIVELPENYFNCILIFCKQYGTP
jgi:hypothetical protein